MKSLSGVAFLVFLLFLNACGGGGSDSSPSVATGPRVTVTAVEVGKMIFEDTRLSANRNQSCATCHAASAGFADPDVSKANPVSEGSIAGKFGDRNAPPSAYAKFAPAFEQIMDPVRGLIYAGGQFLDGRRDTLEQQAKDPFLNPVEMANPNKQAVVDKVQNGPYADQFMAVYGSNVFTDTDTAFDRIAEAIAAFERSDEMNPFNSRFDCFQKDPVQYPLDTQEQMGLNVFQGKGKCANCHTLDTDPVSGKILFTNFQYFNIGVPANPDNPANKADAGFVDFGLGGRLGAPAENGKFKTPTLRNIEKTSPYMHNGVFDTLTEVVEFYNIEEKEFASPPPEVINDINPDVDFLDLNSEQIEALVAFLKTLTDGTGLCF